MLQVKIEGLTFPEEDVEFIELRRNGEIKIHLSDTTVGQKHKEYGKWINICGTMHEQIVEQVTIGKHHFEGKKFLFRCDPSIGIVGRKADNIIITLTLQPDGRGL